MAKKTAPPIRTQDELAVLLDRDKAQISRYIRHESWPFAKRAPWSRAEVPKMLRWMADTLESVEAPESGEELKALRKQKLKEETRKLHHQANAAEIEYERTRGNVVGVDEMRRRMVKVAGVYVSQLQGIIASLPPLLEGKPASEIQDELEKAIGQILENVRNGMGGLAGGAGRSDPAADEDATQRMGGQESDDAGGSHGGAGPVPE